MSVRYYLVAVLFILFDVEVIFFLPWAVTFKSLGLFSLIDAILEIEKRTKDEGYRARLDRFPVPRLFDMFRSASRRQARATKAEPKKAEEKAPAKKTAKAAAPKAAKAAKAPKAPKAPKA